MYPRPAGDDAGPRALQAVTLRAELRERGIGLHVIEQGIDTDTMEGRAMSGMLTKERIRYLAALTDATRAQVVDRAVEEYVARHADAINEGIERAQRVSNCVNAGPVTAASGDLAAYLP